MIDFIGLWSHALAAILYGALGVWQLRHSQGDTRGRPLAAAFAVTALWAIFMALLGPRDLLPGLAESARNFAFLAFMYSLVRSADDGDGRQRGVKFVYTAVAGVIGLQVVIAGLIPRFEGQAKLYEALTATSNMLGLTIAAGALVLVHNLYGQASADSRWRIRLPMIALAGMWMYDLHLYTIAYVTHDPVGDLFAMRGAFLAGLVPLFALATKRNAQWKVQLSRAATFQSLSIVAILAYLIVVMSASRALEFVGGEWVRIGQTGLIFAVTLAAMLLLPSGKARALARVLLAKHFFEHRYDYREEWLRFTRTIGRGGDDAAPLGDRIVKALADVADAPGGLLLLANDQGRLDPTARWNWDAPVESGRLGDYEFVRFLETTSHIIDFQAVVDGTLRAGDQVVALPSWMLRGGYAWAGLPLMHADHLVGLVILRHPLVRRPLDWEDFDLFRTAGIQAASYLAEARSQEALANANRFDEFNRRFAFIMHDIKNLVSQLSLVAHNAERHADNPAFRADMIATLQGSVRKMNDLLAKLSRGNAPDTEPLRAAALDPIVSAVANAKNRIHPVEHYGEAGLSGLADPVRLEQVLIHLVQNAIDASAPDAPVRICVGARDAEVAIEIIDSGVGMSAEFIRTRLFEPFASTKDGGFGIGAFEARALVTSMGGRLDVESREGEGSRFTILLPAGPSPAAPQLERMRA